jgi:diguanylate cyclase (GGDEF)-like protein
MDIENKNALSIEKLREEIARLRAFILEFNREASEIVDEDEGNKMKIDARAEIDRLRDLVFKDELTQVLNRRGFYEHFLSLFQEALYAKKNPGGKREFSVRDFSIIFIDADNFKTVNDTYGHDAGDVVLKGVADTLRKSIRDIDAVARFGGEEFIVALVGAGEEEGYRKAEEIRERITAEVKVPNKPDHTITASVGVSSLCMSDADNLDELVAYADQAMYEAKANRGKDNTVRFSELKK